MLILEQPQYRTPILQKSCAALRVSSMAIPRLNSFDRTQIAANFLCVALEDYPVQRVQTVWRSADQHFINLRMASWLQACLLGKYDGPVGFRDPFFPQFKNEVRQRLRVKHLLTR